MVTYDCLPALKETTPPQTVNTKSLLERRVSRQSPNYASVYPVRSALAPLKFLLAQALEIGDVGQGIVASSGLQTLPVLDCDEHEDQFPRAGLDHCSKDFVVCEVDSLQVLSNTPCGLVASHLAVLISPGFADPSARQANGSGLESLGDPDARLDAGIDFKIKGCLSMRRIDRADCFFEVARFRL